MSATPWYVDIPHFKDYAQQSEKKTDDAGNLLASQLQAAIGSNMSNVQLIGHSHGAKVATVAALDLKGPNNPVKQLTLLDSPDSWTVAAAWPMAGNTLDPYLSKLPIGNGVGKVFVDNYISSFGRQYGGGVVNVNLDGSGDVITNHGYPINWYTASGTASNPGHVGIDWSPLTLNQGQSLSTNQWKQWWRDLLNVPNPAYELNLVPAASSPSPVPLRPIADLETLFTSTNVTVLSNGLWNFVKHSPAYWDSTFTRSDTDVAMQFTYQFIQPGEGDQLAVWIDNELRFVATGELVGTGQQVGAFDISDLTPGPHVMTFALQDYGSAPAEFSVWDLKVLSVPEPSSIVLLGAGASSLLGYVWRRRKRMA